MIAGHVPDVCGVHFPGLLGRLRKYAPWEIAENLHLPELVVQERAGRTTLARHRKVADRCRG